MFHPDTMQPGVEIHTVFHPDTMQPGVEIHTVSEPDTRTELRTVSKPDTIQRRTKITAVPELEVMLPGAVAPTETVQDTRLPRSEVLPGTAISLLDKLLAKSRTVQEKLDKMTTTPSRVSAAERTRVARGPSMPAERPAAVLDRCLAQ